MTKSYSLCGIAAVLSLCIACAAANAATVNLKKDSNNGFTSGDDWDDNGNPPMQGKDYLVANGYYLRGDNSQAFAGDSLQFGVVGGTEGIFFKEHTGSHTFKKLILANGMYRTWMSSNGQSAYIRGAVEVLSPESAPFRLHSTHGSSTQWWNTYWEAGFTGAATTGLKIGPYPLNGAHLSAGQTIFTGDNSGYLGSIEAYGTNAVFAFTTGTSLGGPRAAFKADALRLCDGTTLESRGDDVTLAASLNRGVTVAATGGRISVPSGKALRLEWPIAGEGRLSKIGGGTLTLAGAMSLAVADPSKASLAVSNGCVAFASGFSNGSGGKIHIAAGGEASVPAGDEVEVCNLALGDGAFRVAYDGGEETSGVLKLGTGCELGTQVNVYPPPVREIDVPFLKVPTTFGTVVASDFAVPDGFAATGLPSVSFRVATEGGYQTVYAKTAKLVTVSDVNDNKVAYIYDWFSDRWRWSDGKSMHGGADYYVGGGKTISSTGLSGEVVASADSITLEGSGTTSLASFDLGTASLTKLTGDIRTGNYVRFKPTAQDNGNLHLCGKLHVGGTQTSDACLDFRAAKSGITLTIDSAVSGSGWMCFQPPAANYTNAYCFTADNMFTGVYYLHGGKDNSHTVVKFASVGSWGADPAAFRSDSVKVQGYGSRLVELYPMGSQTVDFANRGFLFEGSAVALRVDAGEVFELNAPVTITGGGTTKKIGGGTWAVGSKASVSGSGTATIAVVDGYLRADDSRAFVDVAVNISDGAGIAAKYRPGDTSETAVYGMIVTNSARFAFGGGALKVKVATGGADIGPSNRIGILTVPEETAAAIDANGIVFEHDDAHGRQPVLVKEAVTVSGVSMVRYSCKFTKGFIVIFQ